MVDLVSRVLFPAPPSTYSVDSFPGELLWVPRSLNPQLSTAELLTPCLFLEHENASMLIIYFHTNGEDVGRCRGFCENVRYKLGVHVLAVEYPTYGVSRSRCCDEISVIEAAKTAIQFVTEVMRWPSDDILFLGRSIGAAVAIEMATQFDVAGLILVSPFLSVQEVCREIMGLAANLITDRFLNKDLIPLIKCPCLFIHGVHDRVVPHRHGEMLFEACTSRKEFVSVEMTHNTDLMSDPSYFIFPTRQFFGLPRFDDRIVQVPDWVFDRQLLFQTPLDDVGPCYFWANVTSVQYEVVCTGHKYPDVDVPECTEIIVDSTCEDSPVFAESACEDDDVDVLSASGRMSSEGTEYWLGGDEVVLAYGQPSPCEATCTEVASMDDCIEISSEVGIEYWLGSEEPFLACSPGSTMIADSGSRKAATTGCTQSWQRRLLPCHAKVDSLSLTACALDSGAVA